MLTHTFKLLYWNIVLNFNWNIVPTLPSYPKMFSNMSAIPPEYHVLPLTKSIIILSCYTFFRYSNYYSYIPLQSSKLGLVLGVSHTLVILVLIIHNSYRHSDLIRTRMTRVWLIPKTRASFAALQMDMGIIIRVFISFLIYTF